MDIRAKKSLGQNFLTDPQYLRRIVAAAMIAPGDQVIEIGPGLGHLTRELAARAGRLLVIELDGRLIPRLRGEFAGHRNIEIVHADALEYPYGALTGAWKVVANLPYYISTPLIQRLLEHRGSIAAMTIMLQKEVAERIAAMPGRKEYGFLSVLVQHWAAPRLEFIVPPGAFTPRPKVDSEVLTLTVRERPEHPVRDEALFLRVIKAAFSQRRKTLRNALGPLGYPRAALDDVQAATGVDLGRRAETLSAAEFAALSDFLAGTAGSALGGGAR